MELNKSDHDDGSDQVEQDTCGPAELERGGRPNFHKLFAAANYGPANKPGAEPRHVGGEIDVRNEQTDREESDERGPGPEPEQRTLDPLFRVEGYEHQQTEVEPEHRG